MSPDRDLPAFDMVVFGGRGDLARRKLMPSLYHLEASGLLPEQGRVLAMGRPELSRERYLEETEVAVREHLRDGAMEPDTWRRFAARVDYLQHDATDRSGYTRLAERLGQATRPRGYYLATSPGLYGQICESLGEAGLASAETRVVLEKPIGSDLASAREINAVVARVFGESQVFRIDHYLGKETVQNLMALRFGNALFEPLWRAPLVDHVQVTVAESLGVEARGDYYDQAGALRDMVQNHLLQLLCLTAMEPPGSLQPDAIRDEKLKVLRSLRPIDAGAVGGATVRAQYRAGSVAGTPVPGYREEEGVRADSETETFVALKAEIDNWRWAGVPFYLRTGKRMQQRATEITVQFARVPHLIFDPSQGEIVDDRLVIRLQPQEGIKLLLNAKSPGAGMRLRPVQLNLDFAQAFKGRRPGAYERLLLDFMRGDSTLFMRRDEVESAWAWIDGVRAAWEHRGQALKSYPAGSWGPTSSIALIERDGRTWHEELP